jgi:hypothetical protein
MIQSTEAEVGGFGSSLSVTWEDYLSPDQFFDRFLSHTISDPSSEVGGNDLDE